MFLLIVVLNLAHLIFGPFKYTLKLFHNICFRQSQRISSLKSVFFVIYNNKLMKLVEGIGEILLRFSEVFFMEKPNTRGLMFHILENFLNLLGMFMVVFLLAAAFYPIITFLSVIAVPFILFQVIVNQGIVNYYYYFSNKNSGGYNA